MKINILHLSNSLVAGAPSHLSKCLNKYSEYNSKCVVKNGKFKVGGHLDNLSWDYDYVDPSDVILNELIEWCDIIHYHVRPNYDNKTFDKPSVVQFQTEPQAHGADYVTRSIYPDFKGVRTCIGQYQTRFYEYDFIVANVLDLEEIKPEYNDKVTIFYGYANFALDKKSWAYKGVKEVESILKDFKKDCNINIVSNMAWKDMIEIKRKADIVIGDCFTGSYHISDLEGLACGAVTFNKIDDKCYENIKQITGQSEIPFQITTIEYLRNGIEYFMKNQNDMRSIQRESRAWMEDCWNPKKMCEIYDKVYEKALTIK